MMLQFQKKRPRCVSSDERDELHTKLQQKIRTLQQKLRRTKTKMNTMHDVIQFLEEKLVLNPKESEALLSTLNNTQLIFLYNFQDNIKSAPSARRYSDEIKEFALTLYFYSPWAYKYVRSLVPLPNPSLTRKWSSSFKCDPGFIDEAFTSLSQKVAQSNNDKDCCLVIDAMSIRKQTI
ncbi:THAP domain-containing 9 [Paramuricea clavata]|uniref:THAP domain-containing 9, partial n=1 Tax=Paramuricea clavata TaxID=317549 RepID=A0A6S7GSB2_PARCT|nr:THAP domain-containing 9 [Paramuricea clavata]